MKLSLRRAFRWAGLGVLLLLCLSLVGVATGWLALRGSLGRLDGSLRLDGLSDTVTVERDEIGVPTIRAKSRADASRALGFLHAQDRFFQMDISRRAGAGELAALFGPIAVDFDWRHRVHRPRVRAQTARAQTPADDAALLQAYTEGVNAGLASLRVRPPEYLALRTAPEPWRSEDLFLVAYAMFADLHDTEGGQDYRQECLRKVFSPEVLAFLESSDPVWSAAIDGTIPAPVAMPAADQLDFRPANGAATPSSERRGYFKGSNSWAVNGRRSSHPGAIVANDMHLGLRVPNTWYRVRLIYDDPQTGRVDVVGVTLPGTPVIVSGSNGYIAWANTASCVDISDLVLLDRDPADARRYRTPEGWRELERRPEEIMVLRQTNVTRVVEETIWGPLVTHGTNTYALACTTHFPEAVNLGLIRVEQSRDTETALRRANVSGTPVNNFLVGDRKGAMGYSLLGRLPRRVGFDGATPSSWADGQCGWRGWLTSDEYPRFLNPADNALWTANNRVLGSPEYLSAHIVDEDNGARAQQIRDRLLALEQASERDLWEIYRDDRALFLQPWQGSLSVVLTASTNRSAPMARELVENWGARAATNSAGYRLVRSYRDEVLHLVFAPFQRQLSSAGFEFSVGTDAAAWRLLRERPSHLLNPACASWDALLQTALDHALERGFEVGKGHLAAATWGERNRLGMMHPLSQGVPRLSRYLDMPNVPISGDSFMPKVHGDGFGVSERMVVAPGREADGLYNMPGGQSGHFLSPFYRSEMDSWLNVEPRPLLPGKALYRLVLHPR